MKFSKKKIFILLGFLVTIGTSYVYLFRNKTTLINIKNIPITAPSYVIIDPVTIANDIKSHYLKNPNELLAFFEEIGAKEIDQEIEIDQKLVPLKINFFEPFCIYQDTLINAVGYNFSLYENKDIIPWVSNYYNYNSDTLINNIKLSLYDSNKVVIYSDKHQIRAFYVEQPNSKSLELISKTLLNSKTQKSKFQNVDALKFYKEKKAAITYNYTLKNKNKFKPFLNNIYGTIETQETKYIFNSKLNFDTPILKKYPINYIKKAKNNLFSFSANLNNTFIEFLKTVGIKPLSFYEKYCNGEVLLAVSNFKNLNTIPGSTINEILNCTDFEITLGIQNQVDLLNFSKDLNLFKRKVHKFFSLKDSLKYDYIKTNNQLTILNFEEKIQEKEKTSSPLNLKIDFEKIILLKNQDFFFKIIKSALKRVNFEALKIETLEISDQNINLFGEITTIDTSQHVLFSPLFDR